MGAGWNGVGKDWEGKVGLGGSREGWGRGGK